MVRVRHFAGAGTRGQSGESQAERRQAEEHDV
jgi:hypothetical protein